MGACLTKSELAKEVPYELLINTLSNELRNTIIPDIIVQLHAIDDKKSDVILNEHKQF